MQSKQSQQIPMTGFARIWQFLGSKGITEDQARQKAADGKPHRTPKPAVIPLIPISRAAWYDGIKKGRYPKGIKLSERTTVWRWADIAAVLEGTYRRDDEGKEG